MSAHPWTVDDIPSQEGRTVVVTGATSGLGLESALALAGAGARVLLAARNAEKAERARSQVAAVATGPEPEVVALDLADLASVRSAAADIATRAPQLDVLMNNAGVMALPHAETADGFEMQLGTNHLGHFALTGLVLPQLLAADAPRVVTTSSGAHKAGRMRWDDLQSTKRYQRWVAYSQSKLANLLFTYELDRRARAAKTALASVAAHPGYAATHLQAAGPEMSGSTVGVRVMELANRVAAQSAADGALPQLYAATMPDVRGGEYFGASRLFETRGAPTRVESTKRSHSRADASRLWHVSEQLTDVRYPWPEGATA
ncbi:SDR family NAD(P)-dependent oxidoreductase [Iamia sp. SCSIO 61187]|uniref:oxidoreductase n=1 Tax=Iamia sp. SCSIO 61187 TaxID=2722752 RepID=UPI001C634829|nr:oxidoreductase [Iamia sp. SCSIO 61187]QYG94954.1 SDR family NAD(P)-dependent oxidoreductase [Iamia sp. SCSIO 61187]